MSLPLSHAGGSVDGISAALDLRFASSLSLTSTSGITPSFSRASTGTYFNSSGVLTTAAINAPRFDHVYNGSSWVSKGLLVEEQRTNGIAYSRDFSAGVSTVNATLTTNTNLVISPENGTNAAGIAATSTGTSFIYLVPSSSSNTIYTVSIYAKQGTSPFIYMYDQWNVAGAWFNLSTGAVGSTVGGATASIVAVRDGWYRCILTKNGTGVTPVDNRIDIGVSDTAGSYSVTSGRTAYVYGVQREVGSFATSYIPTTSSTATRSADVCQITGGDFTSFWNASEGSVAVEFDYLFAASAGTFYPYVYEADGSSGANRILAYGQTSTSKTSFYVEGGGGSSTLDHVFFPAVGTAVKIASTYKVNDLASSLNGAAVLTDTSQAMPTVSRLSLGSSAISPGVVLNGHIARLRYFNKRLTNQQLEDLCKPEQQLKLDLNFSSSLSLTPTVGPTPSFSRSSTGTYFNSAGLLTSAAINGPRFNHVYNGSSWVSKGLLIEEQRTNTATYSEDFSNAAWTKTTATISANLAAAPDGTTTADLCYPTSTGTFRGFYRTFSSAAVSMSIFAKSSGKTAFAFIASDGNTVGASFNLATGTVSNVFSGHTASVENCGGGWYWCKMAATTTAMQVFIQDGQGSSGTVTANSTDGVLFWGAQVETGAFPTSYIPTTSTSVTRSADVCQITGTDFSGIWNLSAGSIVVDGDSAVGPSLTGGAFLIWYLNGTPELYYYYRGGDGILAVDNVVRKTVITTPAANTRLNTAIAFSASDFAASVNGAAVTTSANLTMPVGPTIIQIGGYIAGNQMICGHISRLRYYAIRLPNRLLIAKST